MGKPILRNAFSYYDIRSVIVRSLPLADNTARTRLPNLIREPS